MVFFQRKVIAMKIVGSHDEIMALKLACQNRSQCEHCIMHVFCQIEGNNVLVYESDKTLLYFRYHEGLLYRIDNGRSYSK